MRAGGAVIELDRDALAGLDDIASRGAGNADRGVVRVRSGFELAVSFAPYRTGSAFLIRELKPVSCDGMNIHRDIKLDFGRRERMGLDEAILAGGKTVAHLAAILDQAAAQEARFLLTRLAPEQFQALPEKHRARLDYDELSRTGYFGEPEPATNRDAHGDRGRRHFRHPYRARDLAHARLVRRAVPGSHGRGRRRHLAAARARSKRSATCP